MKTSKHILITSFILSILLSFSFKAHALAEGTYQIIVRKQQEKQQSRWSLLDWMNTKKKMAIMDQWLALNSSVNHFEFALFGAKVETDRQNTFDTLTQTKSGYEAGFSMYYKIFGLEGSIHEVEQTHREKNYSVGLRIFGKSDQGPNIKVLYGMSDIFDYNQNKKITANTFGGKTTIYLAPFLGLEGSYQKYLTETFPDSTTELSGEKIGYGGFLELSFLRLYYLQEKRSLYYQSLNSRSKRSFDSSTIGAKLFF